MKLSKAGAIDLAAWLRSSGTSMADLSREAGCSNRMAIPRALEGQGRLSLEEIARIVAFTFGELPAERLVDEATAPRVPVLAPRARRPAGPGGAWRPDDLDGAGPGSTGPFAVGWRFYRHCQLARPRGAQAAGLGRAVTI